MEIVSMIFLVIGGLFYLLGGLGVLRMPDTFNRIQAGTKATTLGAFALLLGVGIYGTIHQDYTWLLKVGLIIVFITISNPIGSSVLAKATYRSFEKPSNLIKDELGGSEDVE